MSAPPSGSASGSSTTAGYYPDPSIPGYIRYWDGASWVPGTSRPEPRPGEPAPTAPGEEPQPGGQSPEGGGAPESVPSEPADAVPAQRTESPQEPVAGGLPELRPRGDVDVRESGQIAEWDDPARLHGQRPESASSWQADAGRQSGFGGEQDQRVSWGSPADRGEPGGGWQRPQAAPPGEAPAVAAAPQHPQLPPAAPPQQPAPPQQSHPAPAAPPAHSAPPAQSTPPAQTPPAQPAPVQPAPEAASPRHEQTTQLRRSDIVKARRAAREAQAAQQAAAPAQAPVQPGPQSAPPARPASEGGWQQQVRDLAAPPGGHGGSSQGGDGLAAPWRPPASDPFLRAAMDQARPAALGKRIAARLIDTLVTAAVGAAVALPLLPKAQDHIDTKVAEIEQAGVTQDIWLVDGTTGLYLAMVIGAVLVFGLLYEALPNARWGRTLGKKLLGLRVLSMEEQEPPGFGKAAVRWLVQGSLGFLVIGVVNLFWAFVDKPWRQCWHDKAAGTFTAEGGGEVRLG